jgi:hypothetical protein
MGNKKDVTGEKYHILTITGLAPSKREPSGSLVKRVYTVCECGNTNESSYKNLKRGIIKSCGCLNEKAKTKVNIGETFNHWTLVEEIKPFVEKRRYLVRCVCGQERVRALTDIYRGATKSCGCRGKIKIPKEEKLIPEDTEGELWKQSINHPQYYVSTLGRLFHFKAQSYTNRKRLHEGKDGHKSVHILKEMYWLFIGDYDKTIYTPHLIGEEIKLENLILKETKTERYRKLRIVYSNIKVRCYNKNSKDYKNYGERGIAIEESFNIFDKFFNWAVSNGYKEGLEIDRKNNNSNYSEINCRWVTKAENTRNRRASIMTWELVDDIRFGMYENMTIQEIANILNCSWSTIKAVRDFKTWIK